MSSSTEPILLVVLLVVVVLFMFRNSRKRKQQTEQMATTMVPGAEVMTNYGLYGRIISVDEAANIIHLEVAAGTVIRVHRQSVVRVVTPDEAVAVPVDDATPVISAEEYPAPEFGERIEDENPSDTKPTTDDK